MKKPRYRTQVGLVRGRLASEKQSSDSHPSARPPNSAPLPKRHKLSTQATQPCLLNLSTPPRALGRKRAGQGGPGWGRAGSSARQSGPGQDGKSGGLRSAESEEVIEGHSTGRVQAGEWSSEEDPLQPVLALSCPDTAKLPLAAMATRPGTSKGPPGVIAEGEGQRRTVPAPCQPGSHHWDSMGC